MSRHCIVFCDYHTFNNQKLLWCFFIFFYFYGRSTGIIEHHSFLLIVPIFINILFKINYHIDWASVQLLFFFIFFACAAFVLDLESVAHRPELLEPWIGFRSRTRLFQFAKICSEMTWIWLILFVGRQNSWWFWFFINNWQWVQVFVSLFVSNNFLCIGHWSFFPCLPSCFRLFKLQSSTVACSSKHKSLWSVFSYQSCVFLLSELCGLIAAWEDQMKSCGHRLMSFHSFHTCLQTS